MAMKRRHATLWRRERREKKCTVGACDKLAKCVAECMNAVRGVYTVNSRAFVYDQSERGGVTPMPPIVRGATFFRRKIRRGARPPDRPTGARSSCLDAAVDLTSSGPPSSRRRAGALTPAVLFSAQISERGATCVRGSRRLSKRPRSAAQAEETRVNQAHYWYMRRRLLATCPAPQS